MFSFQHNVEVHIWMHLWAQPQVTLGCVDGQIVCAERRIERALPPDSTVPLLIGRSAKQEKVNLTRKPSFGLCFQSSSNCMKHGAENLSQRLFVERVIIISP